MALTLEREPQDNETPEVATKVQVYYKFFRKDELSMTYENNGGTLQYKHAGDTTGLYTSGDRIYIGDSGDTYDEITTVATVPAFGGGFTTFDTGLAYISAGGTKWVNNLTTHTNYRVEIDIYDSAGTTLLINESFEYVPKQSGVLEIDIKDICDYLLMKDELLSLEITPKYRPVWVEDVSAAFVAASTIHCIPGSILHQQLDTGYTRYLADGFSKSFLTSFWWNRQAGEPEHAGPNGTPKLWRGWGNQLSFIVDALFNARTGGDPQIEETSYDAIGSSVASLTVAAVSADVDVVEYTIVNNNNAEPFLEVHLENDNDNGFESNLFYFENVTTTNCDNSIMLRWLNELGGRSQYLFKITNDIEETVTPGVKVDNQIISPVNTNRLKKTGAINKSFRQKITVVAEKLTRIEFDAMKFLFRSENIRAFSTKDGTVYEHVTVNSESIIYSGDAYIIDISFIIEFPMNYDWFKQKEY